jgi:hypothetical protein
MAATPQIPVITKPIPTDIQINEGSPWGPLHLQDYIQSPDPMSGEVRFYAELQNGMALPKGLFCSMDGLFGGVPEAGTAGAYQIILIAENDSEDPLIMNINLTVNTRPATDDPEHLRKLKFQVWEALVNNNPIPEMTSLLNRPITATEIYYLLQRYAVLSIWDVYNLEPPGPLKLLNLAGNSPHYNVYDRGSSLIAAPKDLFSYQRTLADAIQASKVLAREVYKRGWTIEFAGFNKMARAAWIELKVLGDKTGKQLEVLHYTPDFNDLRIYSAESTRAAGLSL